MAVDPRNFTLNTDYEMDKIICFFEGSLDVGQYDYSFNHGLGVTPLLFGVCAYNSGFTDPRPIPYIEWPSVEFRCSADANKIYLGYVNQNGTPTKIYYRLYGFEPSNSVATIAATNNRAGRFVLNTDYNYSKLFRKGIVDNPSSATIAHGLGYIPHALFWREYDGQISPINYLDPVNATSAPANITVGTSTISLSYPSSGTSYPASKVHYRIYYDEA